MTPTVGRIVHYFEARSVEPRAAIVVRADGERINLRVFDESFATLDETVIDAKPVDESGKGWAWPPRV